MSHVAQVLHAKLLLPPASIPLQASNNRRQKQARRIAEECYIMKIVIGWIYG
jgi:hypothetical protein